MSTAQKLLYKLSIDPFVQNKCVRGMNCQTTAPELYNAYCEYCKQTNAVYTAPRKAFMRYVRFTYGLSPKQVYYTDTQKSKIHYFGLKLS